MCIIQSYPSLPHISEGTVWENTHLLFLIVQLFKCNYYFMDFVMSTDTQQLAQDNGFPVAFHHRFIIITSDTSSTNAYQNRNIMHLVFLSTLSVNSLSISLTLKQLIVALHL